MRIPCGRTTSSIRWGSASPSTRSRSSTACCSSRSARCSAAWVLPFAVGAARDLTSWRYLPYPGTARYVADLAAYVRPGPAPTVLGPRIGRAFDRDLTDTTVFPGYVLLGAGIAVLARRRSRRGLGFWILLGACAFVLSLGPSLRVAGRDLGLPRSFSLLPHVPVLRAMP